MIYGIDTKYTIVCTHKYIIIITNEPLDSTKFFPRSIPMIETIKT